MAHPPAQYWVDYLGLKPLPDGGFFRETLRSGVFIPQSVVRNMGAFMAEGDRTAGTCILYLMTRDSFRTFHRLRFDEVWHYYTGAPCQLHLLHESTQRYESIVLGADPERMQHFQGVIRAGTWFAAEVMQGPGIAYDYSLVGCTVSPGFEWADYHLARFDDLVALFPNHRRLIEQFASRKREELGSLGEWT